MFRYLIDSNPVHIVDILPLKMSQKDSHGEFDEEKNLETKQKIKEAQDHKIPEASLQKIQSESSKNFPDIRLIEDVKDIQKDDIVKRLAEHIEIFAIIGNTNHRHRNFIETKDISTPWKMHPSKENNITRISQYEYSCYAKRALTIDEFNQLREKVEEIAKKCHANLHLLLSSFPVEINDYSLNCVIYVECGAKPILTTMFKKYTLSDADYSYSKPSFAYSHNQRETLIKNNIRPECTFEFYTAGGTLVNAAVEICRDHVHGRAQMSMVSKLMALESGRLKGPFSPWITHVITSNTVSIREPNMLTEKVTLADTRRPSVVDKNNFLSLTYSDAPIISHKYPTKIHSAKISIQFSKSIVISSPPFGKDYTMYATREHTVSRFTHPLILEKMNSLEPIRFINLEIAFSKNIKHYLQKKRAQSRHDSISRINTLFTKLKLEEDKPDRVDSMLKCFQEESEKEQAKHTAQFFKRNKASEYAELLKNHVNIMKTSNGR